MELPHVLMRAVSLNSAVFVMLSATASSEEIAKQIDNLSATD
jgi:hypothetical protein